MAQRQELRVAPLPSPDELAGFEKALPGLAERIVRMAELNGEDRRANNRTMRWATILGQVFAFVIFMTALLGGIFLIKADHNAAGIAAIIAAIGTQLGVLVIKRAWPE